MWKTARVSVLVLLFCLAASAVWAQEPSTARISDHWVSCEVTIQGQKAQLKVANGELATVKILAMDRTFGLTPVVRDAEVFMVLWEITPAAEPPAGRIRQLETLPASLRQVAHFTKSEVPLTVTLTDVNEITANAGQAEPRCARCAVTCGGVEVRANKVVMECDRCDCDGTVSVTVGGTNK